MLDDIDSIKTYIKDMKLDEFQVGDICIFKRGEKHGYLNLVRYIGKECVVVGKHHWDDNWNEECYRIHFKDNDLWGHCFDDNLTPIDPEILKMRKRKQEELKLRMINIDPYGEEDWGDEIKENLNIFKYNDRVLLYGDAWKFNDLDELRLKGYMPNKNKEKVKGVIRYISDNKDKFLICGDDGKFYIAGIKYIWLLDDKEMAKRGMEWAVKDKDIKEKTKDIDPYGEEDWDETSEAVKEGMEIVYIGDKDKPTSLLDLVDGFAVPQRAIILNLLRKELGKKMVFYSVNRDDNNIITSSKKIERIIIDVHWHVVKDLHGWQYNLILVGSKSEYDVHPNRPLGFHKSVEHVEKPNYADDPKWWLGNSPKKKKEEDDRKL